MELLARAPLPCGARIVLPCFSSQGEKYIPTCLDEALSNHLPPPRSLGNKKWTATAGGQRSPDATPTSRAPSVDSVVSTRLNIFFFPAFKYIRSTSQTLALQATRFQPVRWPCVRGVQPNFRAVRHPLLVHIPLGSSVVNGDTTSVLFTEDGSKLPCFRMESATAKSGSLGPRIPTSVVRTGLRSIPTSERRDAFPTLPEKPMSSTLEHQ